MLRFSALNAVRKEEEELDETPEPKEPEPLERYNDALLFQKRGLKDKAKEIYEEILLTPAIDQVEPVADSSKKLPNGLSPIYGNTLLTLKYLCYKNIAEIYRDIENLEKSVDYYLKALELDETDVMVWYQVGLVASKLGDVILASKAFILGLEQSPRNLLCLDRASVSLFVQGDFVAATAIVSKLLEENPDYMRAYLLRDLMLKSQPSLKTDIMVLIPSIKLYFDRSFDGSDELRDKLLSDIELLRDSRRNRAKSKIVERVDVQKLLKKLTKLSWVSLGESILHLHGWLLTNVHTNSAVCFITSVNLIDDLPSTVSEQITKEKDLQISDSVEPSAQVEKNVADIIVVEDDTEEEKNGKRRSGSALMEELLWSGKRRSARVRSSRKEQESMSVADALKNILPRKLLHKTKNVPRIEAKSIDDDSMNTMDLYRLFERNDGTEEHIENEDVEMTDVERDHDKIIADEGYFNTVQEENDIKEFLERENLQMLLEIIKSFVLTIEKLWSKKWPKKLIHLFLECYKLMRVFSPLVMEATGPHPSIDHCGADLLYHELVIDSSDGSLESKVSLLSMSEMFIALDYESDFSPLSAFAIFKIRFLWVRALFHLACGDPSMVLALFQEVQDCFTEGTALEGKSIRLPNCQRYKDISKERAQSASDALSRKRSIAEVISLYEQESYKELVEILRESYDSSLSSRSVGRKDREDDLDNQTHLAMLINALYSLKEYKECVYWLETACLEMMGRASCIDLDLEESQEWKIELDRLLVSIESCCELGAIKITDALPHPRLSRFVQTLCHAICRQIEDNERPPCASRPWIVLNRILVAMEEVESKEGKRDAVDFEDDELDIPPSVLLLFTAHEYLGRREWCNCDGNVLLFLIMDQVIPRLRLPEWSDFRETVQQHLEQVVFCLYGHPSKKSKGRYLTDHNVSPITLCWERAMQLFEVFRPDETPCFDGLRVNLISSETEVLFRRITVLIPDEIDPAKNIEEMKNFIFGRSPVIPLEACKLPEPIQDLFYVLGDYYYKTSDSGKAVNYLLIDLCATPGRVDSWASIALSKASLLEQKLNSCESIKNEEFLNEAMATIRCCEHCLSLDDSLSALLIEYGNFAYTIHSFCSQRMKLESDSLSLEQFEEMETTKTKMLEKAKSAFINANNLWNKLDNDERQDERWLHHYMLGKVCEKNGDLAYLQHYDRASKMLYENNAQYPRKIGYKTPQTYAIEAMEIYYRVHVCIIKCLELHDGSPLDEKTRDVFLKALKSCAIGPFAKQLSKADLERQKAKEEEELLSEKKEVARMISKMIKEIIFNVTKDDTPEAESVEPLQVETPSLSPQNKSKNEIEEEKKEVVKEMDSVVTEKVKRENKCSTNVEKDTQPQLDIIELDDLENTAQITTEDAKNLELKTSEDNHTLSAKHKDEDIELNLLKLAQDTEEKFKKTDPVSAALQYAPKADLESDALQYAPVSNSEPFESSYEYEPYPEEEFAEENYFLTLDDFQPNKKPKISRPISYNDYYLGSDYLEQTARKLSVCREPAAKGKKRKRNSGSSSSSSSEEEVKYDDDSSSSSSLPSIATSRSRTDTSSSDSEEKESKQKNCDVIEKSTEEEPPITVKEDPEVAMLESCLKAFETCALRFPQHYKSIYRLAHFFYRSKSHRDLNKCRELLLGKYETPSGVITGLFSDKKNTNFFNGIWRLPAGDVDRPGSFTSHMSRSVLLLLEVLRDGRDHRLLMELCLQLRKVPEPDKRYLREDERIQLSQQALTLALQTIRQIAKQKDMTLTIVLDLYKIFRKIQKHYPAKESTFGDIFIDAFRRYGKWHECPLDLGLKYCQAELTGNKIPLPQPTINSGAAFTKVKVRKAAKEEKPRKKLANISKMADTFDSKKSVINSVATIARDPSPVSKDCKKQKIDSTVEEPIVINASEEKLKERVEVHNKDLNKEQNITVPAELRNTSPIVQIPVERRDFQHSTIPKTADNSPNGTSELKKPSNSERKSSEGSVTPKQMPNIAPTASNNPFSMLSNTSPFFGFPMDLQTNEALLKYTMLAKCYAEMQNPKKAKVGRPPKNRYNLFPTTSEPYPTAQKASPSSSSSMKSRHQSHKGLPSPSMLSQQTQKALLSSLMPIQPSLTHQLPQSTVISTSSHKQPQTAHSSSSQISSVPFASQPPTKKSMPLSNIPLQQAHLPQQQHMNPLSSSSKPHVPQSSSHHQAYPKKVLSTSSGSQQQSIFSQLEALSASMSHQMTKSPNFREPSQSVIKTTPPSAHSQHSPTSRVQSALKPSSPIQHSPTSFKSSPPPFKASPPPHTQPSTFKHSPPLYSQHAASKPTPPAAHKPASAKSLYPSSRPSPPISKPTSFQPHKTNTQNPSTLSSSQPLPAHSLPNRLTIPAEPRTKFNIADILGSKSEIHVTKIPGTSSHSESPSAQVEAINLSPNWKSSRDDKRGGGESGTPPGKSAEAPDIGVITIDD